MAEVFQSPNTLLLYPGPGAVDLSELPVGERSPPAGYNLVILDGTWAQAKGLYCQNEMVQWPRKVSRVAVNSDSDSSMLCVWILNLFEQKIGYVTDAELL